MATCSQIIETAYRRSGVLPAGLAMSSTLSDAGLLALRQWYVEGATTGLFGELEPKYSEESLVEPKEYEIWTITNPAATITLPTYVNDDVDLKRRAPIHMAPIVYHVSGQDDPVVNIYDAYRQAWLNVFDLALGDYAPLSNSHREHLTSIMAVVLADENAVQITPIMVRRVQSARFAFAAKSGITRKRKNTQASYF